MNVRGSIDDLIDRATALVCFLSEAEAAKTLVETGASGEDAYLAVKAAMILIGSVPGSSPNLDS